MYEYGYNAPCVAPRLSGHFDGLGAAMTPAQRRATALARRQTAAKTRTARRTAAKAKRQARIAGRTVNPGRNHYRSTATTKRHDAVHYSKTNA